MTLSRIFWDLVLGLGTLAVLVLIVSLTAACLAISTVLYSDPTDPADEDLIRTAEAGLR